MLLYVDKFAVRGARHAHNQAASAEVPVIRVRQQDVLVPDGASLHGELARSMGQAQEPMHLKDKQRHLKLSMGLVPV